MAAKWEKTARALARVVPMLEWLRGYTRADWNADLVAGVITAILLVPQAMAYSMLAGLPPQVGLYASVAAPLAYALFGSSRTLAVGPVSVAAIMVAEALALPDVQGNATPLVNALVLAAECGVILLAMSALRLGAVVSFLSHPVLSGFTTGAAIVILLTQIQPLLGLASTQSTSIYRIVSDIAPQWRAFNPATLALGIASVALLLLAGTPLQQWLRRRGANDWLLALGRAGPLLVVLGATLAVAGLDLDRVRNVASVGAVPGGLPPLQTAFLRADTWLALFPSAVLIALISYVESFSVAKIVANRRRQRVVANQELTALGAANLACALSGGMPVAGGFARTMVNYAAGARTQVAAVVTALAIALVLMSFAPMFARVPKAALAAIVVVAVAPLINIAEMRSLWRYARGEAAVLLLTLAGVLIAGIDIGLLAGIVASLLAYLWRISRPHVAVVGRIAGTEHFRNIRRHEVETWPHVALIRIDESLTFANIGAVEDFIAAHVAAHPIVEHVVLICSAVNHIDSSALDALERLSVDLRAARATMHLAEVKGPVMDVLERAGLPGRLAPGQIFFRTTDAVQALGDGWRRAS